MPAHQASTEPQPTHQDHARRCPDGVRISAVCPSFGQNPYATGFIHLFDSRTTILTLHVYRDYLPRTPSSLFARIGVCQVISNTSSRDMPLARTIAGERSWVGGS